MLFRSLGLKITHASVFIGVGQDNGAGQVGFTVADGTLDLAVFKTHEAAPRVYTGLQASLGQAALPGVQGVQLIATHLSVKVNQVRAPTAGATPLDWRQAGGLADALNVSRVAPQLDSSDRVEVGGSVVFSIAETVFGSATALVTRTGDVSGVDDPDDAGTVRLKGDLLAVHLSNASVFVGSGAHLDLNSAVVTLPDPGNRSVVGFRLDNATLDLGVFYARESSPDGVQDYVPLDQARKYTGIEAGLGVAALQGVSGIQLKTGSLTLIVNTTSVPNGKLIDWTVSSLDRKSTRLNSSH